MEKERGTNPKDSGRFDGGREGGGEAVSDGATERLRKLFEERGSQP